MKRVFEGIEAFPLRWPEGWKRTTYPAHSKYRIGSIASARDELLHELKLLGAKQTILSSNLRLRGDGLPISNQAQPEDAGVAVYFVDHHGKERVIACDKWRKVEENMRAIAKAVDALRQIDRCGASQILERAFESFAALPAKDAPIDWRSELGDFSVWDLVEREYRRLAQLHHPDRGGSSVRMARINQAYELAKKEFGK